MNEKQKRKRDNERGRHTVRVRVLNSERETKETERDNERDTVRVRVLKSERETKRKKEIYTIRQTETGKTNKTEQPQMKMILLNEICRHVFAVHGLWNRVHIAELNVGGRICRSGCNNSVNGTSIVDLGFRLQKKKKHLLLYPFICNWGGKNRRKLPFLKRYFTVGLKPSES